MFTYRKDLTRPLTSVEVDENFTLLNDALNALSAKIDYDNRVYHTSFGINPFLVSVDIDNSKGSMISLDLCSIPIDLTTNYSITCNLTRSRYPIGSDLATVTADGTSASINNGVVTANNGVNGFTLTYDSVTSILKFSIAAYDISLYSKVDFVVNVGRYDCSYIAADNTVVYS